MYCRGMNETKCSNCGYEAYEHSHDFIMASNGVSVNVSVDNACTLQEAAKEAKTQLEKPDSERPKVVFDISNGVIDNPMTCIVKNIEFEDMELI